MLVNAVDGRHDLALKLLSGGGQVNQFVPSVVSVFLAVYVTAFFQLCHEVGQAGLVLA